MSIQGFPTPNNIAFYKTALGEILENIKAIRGTRYGMVLTTAFNIWGLGGLSIHLLGNQEYAEIVMADTLENLVLLYLIDNNPSKEEVDHWTKLLQDDLTMLIDKQKEFEDRNRRTL